MSVRRLQHLFALRHGEMRDSIFASWEALLQSPAFDLFVPHRRRLAPFCASHPGTVHIDARRHPNSMVCLCHGLCPLANMYGVCGEASALGALETLNAYAASMVELAPPAADPVLKAQLAARAIELTVSPSM